MKHLLGHLQDLEWFCILIIFSGFFSFKKVSLYTIKPILKRTCVVCLRKNFIAVAIESVPKSYV